MNEKTVKLAILNWLKGSLGEPVVFTIDFDIDFVAGNVINGTFGASPIDPVNFTTNQALTLKALAIEIGKTLEIFEATVTGPRQLTCVGAVNGAEVDPITVTVTGGLVQAVADIEVTQEPIAVPCYFKDQNYDPTAPAQNVPKLPYPFGTIRILNTVKIGWDAISPVDPDTGIAPIGGQRKLIVQVDYYGKNPLGEINKAYSALEKVTVQWALQAAGLAIFEKGIVQNLTGMLETKFEERASFDLTLGFAETVKDDLGIIETAELTETIDTGQGEIIIGPFVVGEE